MSKQGSGEGGVGSTVSDTLEKGITYMQEKTLGKGGAGDRNESSGSEAATKSKDPQTDSAIDKASNETVSDFIRDQYKSKPKDEADAAAEKDPMAG
ncbi:MAG: hypothetical protein M1828_006730 [Chrysothrix sp. TS-e1954]|nr:MAG: hypothetical protein M1828_006730 [Chrysothrix sp. TS-e1954]